MFFHLLYIHLFRPFLKYKPASSPLPAHVSPRKFLIQAATAISKLLRLYRRTYGLRQICNIVVYITHTACTVHLLNLPDKFANRDIVHGLNHLEEISESWLCARRTLGILYEVSKRWNIELPDAAQRTFERAETKFGFFKGHDQAVSPKSENPMPPPPTPMLPPPEADTIPPAQFNTPNIPNGGYVPSATPNTSSTSSQNPPRPKGSINIQPQRAADLNDQPGQQQFVMPQAQQQQQQMWNRGQPTQSPVTGAEITSPTMMFGGIEGLMKDQEWWLQDSNQIFASWNGYEHHDNSTMAGVGYPSSIPTSIGEGLSKGMINGTGNGMSNGMGNQVGNGMYNNGTYGYQHLDTRRMDERADGQM